MEKKLLRYLAAACFVAVAVLDVVECAEYVDQIKSAQYVDYAVIFAKWGFKILGIVAVVVALLTKLNILLISGFAACAASFICNFISYVKTLHEFMGMDGKQIFNHIMYVDREFPLRMYIYVLLFVTLMFTGIMPKFAKVFSIIAIVLGAIGTIVYVIELKELTFEFIKLCPREIPQSLLFATGVVLLGFVHSHAAKKSQL